MMVFYVRTPSVNTFATIVSPKIMVKLLLVKNEDFLSKKTKCQHIYN